MTRTAFVTLACAVLLIGGPALAQEKPNQATVDAYVKATFGKASPEWQARIAPDESLAACNIRRNNVSSAESDAIIKRELARVSYPADGKLLGDWKKGYAVANNGRGGQFSDPPGTVAGGNCFACHQLDPKEVSYGTLGPSLAAYGKDRKYDPETMKDAYTKIYNSMAVVPCSNMPRFGTNKVLDEQQIKDVMAYLFDPESPVNK
ncbi:sulfur oxidation c-type cytochrome SoxX [Bosea sp. 124]|uniref:sulfur oxidation c-type cytochrome SoxX n=1 Tax=Bosea sp. 124 TaxID=2135642 RepID=UPI000D3C41EA|nr:sulfur oxidation c-type cytochrome SoxX [Bosea sp. 124]PTM43487.1 monoheme cytochrome SoxX (sulfur oxidation) [Bosea sp. 124]